MRLDEAKNYLNWTKAQLRASNLPSSLSEVNRYYSLGRAASVAGRSILQLLQRHEDSMTMYDSSLEKLAGTNFRKAFPVEQLEESRDYVAKNRALLVLLEGMVKRTNRVRFPIDFNRPLNDWSDHIMLLRNAVRLFCHRATLRIEQKKTSLAINDLSLAIKLGEFLTHEPFLFPQIARHGCVIPALNLIEQLLNRCSPTPKHLDRLHDALSSVATDGLVLHGLIGERCLDLDLLTQSGWKRILDRTQRRLPYEYRRWQKKIEDRTYRSLEIANDLYLYDQLATLCMRPPHERSAPALDLIADTLEGRNYGNINCKTSGVKVLQTVRVENHLIASVNVALTAIEVLRSWLKTRRLPKHLCDVDSIRLPDIPIDPFSGNPLKYRRTKNGFVVYSIGPDFNDGKGRPPRRGTSIFNGGDVVFRIVR